MAYPEVICLANVVTCSYEWTFTGNFAMGGPCNAPPPPQGVGCGEGTCQQLPNYTENCTTCGPDCGPCQGGGGQAKCGPAVIRYCNIQCKICNETTGNCQNPGNEEAADWQGQGCGYFAGECTTCQYGADNNGNGIPDTGGCVPDDSICGGCGRCTLGRGIDCEGGCWGPGCGGGVCSSVGSGMCFPGTASDCQQRNGNPEPGKVWKCSKQNNLYAPGSYICVQEDAPVADGGVNGGAVI